MNKASPSPAFSLTHAERIADSIVGAARASNDELRKLARGVADELVSIDRDRASVMATTFGRDVLERVQELVRRGKDPR